jgi:hypothetical protein
MNAVSRGRGFQFSVGFSRLRATIRLAGWVSAVTPQVPPAPWGQNSLLRKGGLCLPTLGARGAARASVVGLPLPRCPLARAEPPPPPP